MKQPNSLVPIDYYSYPGNVAGGYWLRAPLPFGLTPSEMARRSQWMRQVEAWMKLPWGRLIGTFSAPDDPMLLRNLYAKYGVFSERFFNAALRERVTRKYIHDKVDPVEFAALKTEAAGRTWRPQGRTSAVGDILHHLYEQTALELLADAQAMRVAHAAYKRQQASRTCGLCGTQFSPIRFPEWAYFGMNGFEHCCLNCPIVESPKKAELPPLVRSFVDTCGFIPRSNAEPLERSFTTRLEPSNWLSVFGAYAKMGGTHHATMKYGSWFEALARAGVFPEGTLHTKRGYRCLAKDGHVCHSLDEQRIDDWLTASGIAHVREPHYPAHPDFNPRALKRADWGVDSIFIEYFGMAGDKRYDERAAEKLALADELEIELLPIYPRDLRNLEEHLRVLLVNRSQRN